MARRFLRQKIELDKEQLFQGFITTTEKGYGGALEGKKRSFKIGPDFGIWDYMNRTYVPFLPIEQQEDLSKGVVSLMSQKGVFSISLDSLLYSTESVVHVWTDGSMTESEMRDSTSFKLKFTSCQDSLEQGLLNTINYRKTWWGLGQWEPITVSIGPNLSYWDDHHNYVVAPMDAQKQLGEKKLLVREDNLKRTERYLDLDFIAKSFHLDQN